MNITLSLRTLTFSLLLGAIYLPSMPQANPQKNMSTENLKRLQKLHYLGHIFDDVFFGSLPYQTFN